MVERLTRLDASFLYLEEPDTPMHVGGVLILEAPPGGARRARGPGGGPPRRSCRGTASGWRRCPATWRIRSGSTTPTSTSRTTSAATALPRPGTEAQLLDLVSRLDLAATGPEPPALGDVPGRGAVGGPRRGRDQDPPRARRRAQRDRHRPGAAGRRTRCAGAGAGRVAAAAAAERRRAGLGGTRRVRAPAVGDRGHRPRTRSPTSDRPRPGSPASPAGCSGRRGRRCCRLRTAR